jgi:hypothetical protein
LPLNPTDLGVLGRYLYGPRWQAPLARELKVSRTIMVEWANGSRPITEHRSQQITDLVRDRHDRRAAMERAGFLGMAESLASPAARATLLAMIANEVQARVAAITRLTGEIESSAQRLGRLATEEVLRPDGHDPDFSAHDLGSRMVG